MIRRKLYIALLLCLAFVTKGIAQTAKSAYFLDGTFHNFQLNPAMKAERGFAMFGLGNLSMGTTGNVGVSHFLYPKGDQLTTFMSSSVAQDEFLNRLPQSIRLGMNYDQTLLAFGFRLLGGYTSFSVSMHSSTSMALPKGFFEFAKKGLQESTHNLSGINMNTMNYAATTLGYSYEVYKGLRVGVNLKYLMGLAYADFTFDKFELEMSEERWRLESHAQAQAALFSEVYFKDQNTLDNIRLGSFAPSADGFAVDLGVQYDMEEFVPGLTLSASVLNLGKINWKHTMSIENEGTPLEWTGLTEGDINEIGSSLDKEFDQLEKDAEKMMKLKVNEIQATSTNLNATMYLGAEYNMPFYKPLSVAMLYGKKFSPYAGWNDFRAYANVAPLKWFEASVNVGFSTFGTSWGWILNFHPAGFNFFVGSDYMISKVSPQFIPINNFNSHFTLGMNITFGKTK